MDYSLHSPLIDALRAHFVAKAPEPEAPYASRNVVTPPLNLEFVNETLIKEMQVLRTTEDAEGGEDYATQSGLFKEDHST
jgi:hypothetical protein